MAEVRLGSRRFSLHEWMDGRPGTPNLEPRTYSNGHQEWVPWQRHPFNYGDVDLSVQASWAHYSTPRIGGEPLIEMGQVVGWDTIYPLEHYQAVEVALVLERHGVINPEELNVPLDDERFDILHLWQGDVIIGYCPAGDVARIHQALRERMVRLTLA